MSNVHLTLQLCMNVNCHSWFIYFNLDIPSNFQVSGCCQSDGEKRSFLHKMCRKYFDEAVFNTEEVSELATQVQRLSTNSKEGYPCRDCGQTFSFHSGKVRYVC